MITVFPFQVVEKIVDKPLRIRGVAMTGGMSRNFNIYTPEELQAFASKLVNAPVYIEHVSVDAAVGKVTNAGWDGQDMLIKPVQRYIKREVEREIFTFVLVKSGASPEKAKVRLNWGTPETPELVPADLIHAAQLQLIRPEEFRKNAVKFG